MDGNRWDDAGTGFLQLVRSEVSYHSFGICMYILITLNKGATTPSIVVKSESGDSCLLDR